MKASIHSKWQGRRRDRKDSADVVCDAGRIPSIQSFDECLRDIGANTFALELQSEAIQSSKKIGRPTYEQRIIELVRLHSAYRRELQFFRLAYAACDELNLSIHSVFQQLLLNYYLRPEERGSRDEEWLRLAEALEQNLQRYGEVVARAESDWINLAAQQDLRDHSTEI